MVTCLPTRIGKALAPAPQRRRNADRCVYLRAVPRHLPLRRTAGAMLTDAFTFAQSQGICPCAAPPKQRLPIRLPSRIGKAVATLSSFKAQAAARSFARNPCAMTGARPDRRPRRFFTRMAAYGCGFGAKPPLGQKSARLPWIRRRFGRLRRRLPLTSFAPGQGSIFPARHAVTHVVRDGAIRQR